MKKAMKDMLGAIVKDVKNENESKKAAVMLRLISLVMLVYFFLLIIIFAGTKEYYQVPLSLICMVVYLATLLMTYQNRTRIAMNLFNIFTVIWIVSFVVNCGWDTGVQHFLFVQLVLYFLSGHNKKGYKVICMVLLCALRLALYWYTRENAPNYLLSKELVVAFQILNTIAIFAEMSIITMISSAGSHEMEEKLVKYNKKLEKLSSVDELTGLYNRRAMMKSLNELTQQKEMSSCSIAIGDIDFFKKINDNYGHECGDLILEKLSELMSRYMEGKGSVARWGGEEFLLSFEGINGDYAYEMLLELLKQIRLMRVSYEGKQISITMTFGLTEYSNFEGMQATIKEADEKLYRGKDTGRNQVVY